MEEGEGSLENSHSVSWPFKDAGFEGAAAFPYKRSPCSRLRWKEHLEEKERGPGGFSSSALRMIMAESKPLMEQK